MKKTFSILLPPPNITGSLHIGHYFNWSIQDFFLKYKKQKGFETKWYLGLDHAGIATQYIVEKNLHKEGKTRKEIGKIAFNQKINEWKITAEKLIEEQVNNFDFDIDWKKHRFTMDEDHKKLVTQAFITLYNDGLINKKLMLTNWDPIFNTAISDLEIIEKSEKNKIYHIEYKSDNETIFVSTTRPETIFADVALCINPNDIRAKNLKNKMFKIPLTNREIPVIIDKFCELKKGKGVLKVTPAHDHLDYEIGKKYNLEMINIINKDGKLINTIPELDNLTCFDARIKILEIFKKNNINFEEEEWTGIKKYAEKSNSIIETILTEQWFLDVSKMAKIALKESKKIKFYPKTLRSVFKNWMTNIKPWCISRQIWWGHKIPVWYKKNGEIICAISEKDAIKLAKTSEIFQEEGVLDTWFSSALWPMIANEQTDVLVTGKDILFFWVARMIMFNLYFKNELPFKAIYFNGIIRDKNNEKMSKTKGNVIDPVEINEKYGHDVLRYILFKNSGNNKDIKLNEKDLDLGRNFVTKIKNAVKFIYEFMSKNYNKHSELDYWMEQNIEKYKKNIEKNIEKYEIQKATELFYDLFWNNFCCWYIEGLKKFPSENAEIFLQKILEIGYPFFPKTIKNYLKNFKNHIENHKYLKKNNKFEKIIKIVKLLRNIQKTCKISSFFINFEPNLIQTYTKLNLNSEIKTYIKYMNQNIFIEDQVIRKFLEKIDKEIIILQNIIETISLKLKNNCNVPKNILTQWKKNLLENEIALKELMAWKKIAN